VFARLETSERGGAAVLGGLWAGTNGPECLHEDGEAGEFEGWRLSVGLWGWGRGGNWVSGGLARVSAL